ncbi:MAG: type IV pilus modification PilV family protein [Bacillota bacterium]
MSKKGITLIELLASLIILGLVASLVGLLLSTYQNASSTINEEGKANIEATLIIANVRDELNEFNPTNYQECDSDNCIILEKHFAYVYSEENTSIILELYDPPLEYSLEFISPNLSLDGDNYELDYFTFGDDFLLYYTTGINNLVTLHLDFSLIRDENAYEFSMAYTFEIETIPE